MYRVKRNFITIGTIKTFCYWVQQQTKRCRVQQKDVPLLGLEPRYPAWKASMITTYIIAELLRDPQIMLYHHQEKPGTYSYLPTNLPTHYPPRKKLTTQQTHTIATTNGQDRDRMDGSRAMMTTVTAPLNNSRTGRTFMYIRWHKSKRKKTFICTWNSMLDR